MQALVTKTIPKKFAILILFAFACTHCGQATRIESTPQLTMPTIQDSATLAPGDFNLSQAITPQEPISGPQTRSAPITGGEPIFIVKGEIRDILWAEDSNSLYFSLNQNEEEIQQAYSIARGEIEPLVAHPVLPQDARPALLSEDSENVINYSVSPSSETVLFATSIEATATPPEGEGEFWSQVGNVDIILMRNGKRTFIGEIENCIDRFIWSADEQLTLIVALQTPAACMQSPAYLIDLESSVIIPVLDHIENEQLAIYGFSPDSRKLLYNHNRTLAILDTVSLQSIDIELPYRMGESEWIDPDRLLVSFKDGQASDSAIGILQLKTMEMITLLDPQALFGSDDFRVGIRSLSPDGQWIAFMQEGVHGDMPLSLWIKKIE